MLKTARGAVIRGYLFEYDDSDDAINSDLVSENSVLHCSAEVSLHTGDALSSEDGRRFYVDRSLSTGIGLLEVRLKCVKDQRSGVSLGRF